MGIRQRPPRESWQRNFPRPAVVPTTRESVMKAYFNNLPTRTWLLLVVPAVLIAYPLMGIVVPAVVRAVVPQVIRTVLHAI